MDPRRMTLRLLYAMWISHQRTQWEHTYTVVAWTVATFTGKDVDPKKVIPAPFRWPMPPPPQKTPEQRALDSKMAWKLMNRVFGGSTTHPAKRSPGKGG